MKPASLARTRYVLALAPLIQVHVEGRVHLRHRKAKLVGTCDQVPVDVTSMAPMTGLPVRAGRDAMRGRALGTANVGGADAGALAVDERMLGTPAEVPPALAARTRPTSTASMTARIVVMPLRVPTVAATLLLHVALSTPGLMRPAWSLPAVDDGLVRRRVHQPGLMG